MPLIEVLYLAVENQGATYLYAQIFLWLVEYDILSLFVVFNASFSNISVISWQSVILVEETGVPG
jgi:hypothetical protein